MPCSSGSTTFRMNVSPLLSGWNTNPRKKTTEAATCRIPLYWCLAYSTLKLEVMGQSEISRPVQTVRRYTTEHPTLDIYSLRELIPNVFVVLKVENTFKIH
jgi:hypothetical protein